MAVAVNLGTEGGQSHDKYCAPPAGLHPRKLLSTLAQRSLGSNCGGYVERDHDKLKRIENLKKTYGLEHVYRFDIGKNCDGFCPLIREVLEMEQMPSMVAENFMEYPDNQFSQLKAMLSRKYKLSPKWFMVSAGLEIIIDHVARAVFNPGDKFLMPVPNFAVFEEASRRSRSWEEVIMYPTRALGRPYSLEKVRNTIKCGLVGTNRDALMISPSVSVYSP